MGLVVWPLSPRLAALLLLKRTTLSDCIWKPVRNIATRETLTLKVLREAAVQPDTSTSRKNKSESSRCVPTSMKKSVFTLHHHPVRSNTELKYTPLRTWAEFPGGDRVFLPGNLFQSLLLASPRSYLSSSF